MALLLLTNNLIHLHSAGECLAVYLATFVTTGSIAVLPFALRHLVDR